MKLRIERDALTRALAVVGPSIPNRPPVPILACILLEADSDSVSASGFDYETSSHAAIEAVSIAEPGAVVVSGRLLTDIAKSLPARPVDLARDGTRLHIACGQARFSLPLMPVEDYPSLPAQPSAVGVVDHDEFCDAVAQVAVATGRDDTLPMLTGINIEFHKTLLRLVGTDRFRIAIRELAWTPATDSGDDEQSALLVPARALAEATKALPGGRIEIATGATQSILGLRSSGHRHTMRLLDTPYAPYQRYLTDDHTASARIDASALTDAIKRVSLLSPRGTQIRMTFTASTVRLTAGDDNEGHAEETLDCQFDGDPLTIAFIPRYLLDGLTSTHASTIEIALNGPTRAAILRTADQDADSPTHHRHWHILMPLRLPA